MILTLNANLNQIRHKNVYPSLTVLYFNFGKNMNWHEHFLLVGQYLANAMYGTYDPKFVITSYIALE